MHICHKCTKELSLDGTIERKEECPFCHADLHCCLNCRFYDRSAPRQCKEPVAELVREKEKANFCDYFVFKQSDGAGSQDSAQDQARKQLGDLFKK